MTSCYHHDKDFMSEASNPSLQSIDAGTLSDIAGFLNAEQTSALLSTCKRFNNDETKKYLLKKEFKHSNRVSYNKPTVLQRCKAIQKERNFKNDCNRHGFRVGQQVQIISDNQNSFWKGRYKASRLVSRHAFVVGVTPCFVRIVVGSLWSSDLNILLKNNDAVIRPGSRGRILRNVRAKAIVRGNLKARALASSGGR